MKYYIVVLLFITLVVNSFAAYSGTPQMPKLVDGCYEIGSAEELYGFAQWSNESLTSESLCVKIVNDIELNSKVLTADFALNGKESDFALWTPINYFKGTLDGQNHVISGLVVVVKDAHASAGFINTVFGESEEQRAVIKNLGFVDSYVYGDMYVGGIVGHARHLTLDHVFHEGYVNGTTAVGGLIGLASQNNYILNSYNKGFVDSHYETGDLYASRFIGGLAGYIHTEKNLIRNCFSTAKINGVNYTGGLTGIAGIQTELSIENSFTTQDKLYGYEEGSAKVTLVNSFSLGKNSGRNVKTSEEFANGVVATILHNAQYGDIWGQNVGTDSHPVLTGKITNVTENLKLSKVTFHTYDGDTTTYATQYVVGYGLDFPTPKRTGYRFDGWYAKADFSGNPLTRISDKETDDVDVYAKWLKYLEAKDGCYQIANADDLFVFAVMVDESDVDISCAKLTKDIVVNEHVLNDDESLNEKAGPFREWTPIMKFKGTFDGQGHYISGLYYNNSKKEHIGFFGKLSLVSKDGMTVIENLGIKDSYFNGSNDVGSFVGNVSAHVTLRNVYNEGSVNGGTFIGGLVGYEISELTMINVYNTGKVSGRQCTGGLQGGSYGTGNTTIINSYTSRGALFGYVKNKTDSSLTKIHSFAPNASDPGEEAVSREQIANGELATLLHNYSDNEVDGSVWGQRIGRDPHPVFSGKIDTAETIVLSPAFKSVAKVRVHGSSLLVNNYVGMIEIFDVNGILVGRKVSAGTVDFYLNHPGTYIVKMGRFAQKVVAKGFLK